MRAAHIFVLEHFLYSGKVAQKCPGVKIETDLYREQTGLSNYQVQALGQEDPLEKEMATHSNILAWRIPWIGVHGVAKNRTPLSD